MKNKLFLALAITLFGLFTIAQAQVLPEVPCFDPELLPDGVVIGCGRAGYGHEEAARAMGKRGQKPLIHYDYLYLIDWR